MQQVRFNNGRVRTDRLVDTRPPGVPDPHRLGVIYYVSVRTLFKVFAWQAGQDGSRANLDGRRSTVAANQARALLRRTRTGQAVL